MKLGDRALGLAALISSVVLFALRVHVAVGTGFGDSEALYASYALHPQPAYLDHPGLIGSLARVIGRGSAPAPFVTHLVTACLAALVPWVGALASRAAGAPARGALTTALALIWVPELAIGLFGLTPDLPLALTWLGALALAGLAARAPAQSFRALACTLGVGILVGLSTLSKVSGVLLGVSLIVASLHRDLRGRYRTLAPWAALVACAILLSPLVLWEREQGWPMARHRLLSTQAAAGLSLRNLGAFLGGQLAYLTPPFFLGVVLVARDLFRRRSADAISALLFASVAVPAAPLALLCLWSRVAEPHWFAPAYLALAVHLGRAPIVGPRLARACWVTGVAIVAFAWIWIRTPVAPRWLGRAYQPRYDIANDLYAWQPGAELLARSLSTLPPGESYAVVGPHWTICAQAHALLGRRVRVGCNGPRRDDFDDWLPRGEWAEARHVLFVHDSRFAVDPEHDLPGRAVRGVFTAQVMRGGRLVRTLWVTHLEKTGAARAQAGAADRPAERISSVSASGPWLGVVSSVSP
ncbi:MAG: glycosyltransferase family 39 protein [Polyangiaceae bacterium]|nr:glycosyltransferase family 39 protein [Polyangiaceae bacterium]